MSQSDIRAEVSLHEKVCIRDVRFGPKVRQISTKWDKSGTFKDQILVYFVPIRSTFESNPPSLHEFDSLDLLMMMTSPHLSLSRSLSEISGMMMSILRFFLYLRLQVHVLSTGYSPG